MNKTYVPSTNGSRTSNILVPTRLATLSATPPSLSIWGWVRCRSRVSIALLLRVRVDGVSFTGPTTQGRSSSRRSNAEGVRQAWRRGTALARGLVGMARANVRWLRLISTLILKSQRCRGPSNSSWYLLGPIILCGRRPESRRRISRPI